MSTMGLEQAEARSPGSPQRLDMRVPAERVQVRAVRRRLEELDLPAPMLEDARLLLSELVANSVRHAGLGPDEQIRVRADWSGERLRVDVWDRPTLSGRRKVPGAIRPEPGSESGWGLYLVERLSSRWGTGRGRYWFEMEPDRGGRR